MQNKVTDMFVASVYVLAQKTINTGFYQVEPYRVGSPVGNWDWQGHANGHSYYPNTAIIYAILGLVMGTPLNVLIFIPLGILVMVTGSLAFAKNILHTKLFVFAYVLIQVFYLRNFYALSYHILGLFFHTLILMMLFKKLYGRTQDSRSSLIIFILIYGTILTYYHVSAWSLVITITMVTVIILFKLRNVNGVNQKLSFVLVLTLFVACLYFTMETKFYTMISRHPITEVVIDFLTYIRSRLTGSYYPSLRNEYYALTYDPLGRILSYFPLGMILFSMLYTIILLLANIKSKSKALTIPILIFVGIIVVGLFENFSYFMELESFGNRYLQLYAMLIGFYAINNFLSKRSHASKKLWHIAAVILITLIVSSPFYNAYYRAFRGDAALRSGVPALCENSSNWLANHIVHSNVVSEHQVSAFLFMDIVKANKSDSVRVFPLNEDIYLLYEAVVQYDQQILSGLFSNRTYHTFVFLKMFSQKPMFGDVWGYAIPPLNGQESNLYNFTVFNKIYDDGNAIILDYNR